jgi:nucleoside-diphosphate-sugar epimerase
MSRQRKLFLAGATGVIGVQLIPLLIERGFKVAGATRSPEKASGLEAQGVLPVVCDVFDRARLIELVVNFGPEIVMHQLTDLPDEREQLAEFLASNSRIRTEGTRNLLDGAHQSGASQFIAQSIAWQMPDPAGRAVAEHERMVREIGGVVARYGQFYGPGTYHPTDKPDHPRIHVAEAARQTVELIDAPSQTTCIIDPTDDQGSRRRRSAGPGAGRH